MSTSRVADRLVEADEPSIRWKARVNILGEAPDSAEIQALEAAIADAPRTRALTQNLDRTGDGGVPVYAKWQGAQWVLMTLADTGYPRGDDRLHHAADEMITTWLEDRFFNEFEARTKQEAYARLHQGVPVMEGRYRTCASQQGNALYSVLKLALEDERTYSLVERLLFWQWPDGGWNCDKDAGADTSTFVHTLWAMRALALYADRTGDASARAAVERAAEVFLSRRLYRRASNGEVIRGTFTKLHYPLYWHYDILGALKVFAETGITGDPGLGDALDLLESKQLPDGGWPAEERYYKKVSDDIALGNDYVGWGGVSSRQSNEWVTSTRSTCSLGSAAPPQSGKHRVDRPIRSPGQRTADQAFSSRGGHLNPRFRVMSPSPGFSLTRQTSRNACSQRTISRSRHFALLTVQTGFSRQTTTLDDVFFKILDEEREDSNASSE